MQPLRENTIIYNAFCSTEDCCSPKPDMSGWNWISYLILAAAEDTSLGKHSLWERFDSNSGCWS
jgi:hypothetical protein